MRSKAKIAFTCAMVVCMAIVWRVATSGQRSTAMLTYSQFLEQVRTDRVASVILVGSNSGTIPATCRLKDGNTARTVLPADYRDAMAAMQEHVVDIEIRDSGVLRFLLNTLPFLLLLGVWVFFMVHGLPRFAARGYDLT